MWSVTKRFDANENHVGLIIHNLDKVSTYIFDSPSMSIEIKRDSTKFEGMDAIGFLESLHSAAMTELYTDVNWSSWMPRYIQEMKDCIKEKE